MDKNLKLNIVVGISVLVMFIFWAQVGSILESRMSLEQILIYRPYVICIAAGLFMILALAMVRLALRFFVWFQRKLDAANSPIRNSLCNFIERNEGRITLGYWILFLLGLAIALPIIIRQGFI